MIDQWAQRWGVPSLAVADLVAMLGVASEPQSKYTDAQSEQGVQARERLVASRAGGRLWRNNSGAFQDTHGSWIRYGLCNDSKRVNRSIKSADLIGIMPIVITQTMVGTIVGQFVAREVKSPGWKYTGTDREEAQRNFLTLVTALGGDARFVS